MKPYLLIGILLLALTGCRHKTLWMGGTEFATIEVAFDWDGALTRGAGELSMSLYLYPEDGNTPLYYELSGHSGGQIRVPFGRYSAVAWNHENDAILMRGRGSAETLEAYTREQPLLSSLGLTTRAPRPEALDDERSVLEPGPFWTGTAMNLEVSMEAPLKWTIPIEDSYALFSVEVWNVENIEFVSEVSFALSSVCATYFPFTHTLGEEDVTIPFGGRLVGGEYMEGHCTLFGHCPRQEHPHWLTIYAILADGSKYYAHVDVTEQVHGEEQEERAIEVYVDGISFPNPFEGDPFAFAQVDDWLTERIDLVMH